MITQQKTTTNKAKQAKLMVSAIMIGEGLKRRFFPKRLNEDMANKQASLTFNSSSACQKKKFRLLQHRGCDFNQCWPIECPRTSCWDFPGIGHCSQQERQATCSSGRNKFLKENHAIGNGVCGGGTVFTNRLGKQTAKLCILTFYCSPE